MRDPFRLLRAAVFSLVLSVVAFGLTGCLSTKMYVDPALPVVGKAELPVVAEPAPVQVLFEFRTKGNTNASATAEIKPRVIAVVAESGLFGPLGDAAGGGVLKVVVDNVVLTDNAAAKGFGTGLTLGMVGSIVSDGYVCTATYSREGKTTEVTVKHALHTTIGNHAGPANLKPMEPQAAIHQVMDQMVWNALKQLADQHAFD
jgi:hypothetical protein